MMAADICRFVLLGSIPAAAALGFLTMAQLYVVALLSGAATVLDDVANMSYVPFLVGRDRLVEGNAVLHTAGEVAYSGGPAVGGWLVQLAGPASAVAVDAVSFLLSACSLGAIRRVEPPRERTHDRSLRQEIRTGLGYVLGHPVLRMLAASGFLLCMATTALLAVQPVLLVRDLGLAPGLYGLVLPADAGGGILGGLCAPRAGRRLGPIRAIWLPSLASIPFVMLIPFTGKGWLIALYPVGMFAFSVGLRSETSPSSVTGRWGARRSSSAA